MLQWDWRCETLMQPPALVSGRSMANTCHLQSARNTRKRGSSRRFRKDLVILGECEDVRDLCLSYQATRPGPKFVRFTLPCRTGFVERLLIVQICLLCCYRFCVGMTAFAIPRACLVPRRRGSACGQQCNNTDNTAVQTWFILVPSSSRHKQNWIDQVHWRGRASSVLMRGLLTHFADVHSTNQY